MAKLGNGELDSDLLPDQISDLGPLGRETLKARDPRSTAIPTAAKRPLEVFGMDPASKIVVRPAERGQNIK